MFAVTSLSSSTISSYSLKNVFPLLSSPPFIATMTLIRKPLLLFLFPIQLDHLIFFLIIQVLMSILFTFHFVPHFLFSKKVL